MVRQIVSHFESLGWVSNLVTIVGAAVAILALLKKQPRWLRDFNVRRKFSRVLAYVEDQLSVRSEVLAALKRRAKIAIVDDSPDDFPVAYLRQAGFSIDVFESLSLAEAERLTGYDAVLLDIGGVVPEDRMRGGLHLIARLKGQRKGPSVIAVSGLTFDPTVTDFFRQADDVMKKPIAAFDCEERLLHILEERLSPFMAAARIDDMAVLSRANTTGQINVARLSISYLQGRCPVDRLGGRLAVHLSQAQVKQVIEQLDLVRSWL